MATSDRVGIVLGCFFGTLAFGCVFLYFAAAFTADPEADGSIAVHDEADLFNDSVEAAIAGIRFPAGIPVLVRTVDSIPHALIGSYATDQMNDEVAWQALRPRGWLRTYFRQDPAWGPGVYLLVSREPQLVQIRFGHDIRMAAYQEQLAVGPWYLAQQEYDPATVDEHVARTLEDLATRMTAISRPWWLLRWARSAASWVSSELEDWLAPSDGLYSTVVLSNYLKLAAATGGTGATWRFILFNVVTFVALWLVGKKFLIELVLLRRVRRQWIRESLGVLANCGLLGVVLTSFAAIALLSHGRIEDRLALEGLGFPVASAELLSSKLFTMRGGLWLAVPGAVVALFVELVEVAHQMAAEARGGETSGYLPVKWLGWGCALFLMPFAIGVPVFVILVWRGGSTMLELASVEKAN